MKAFFRGLAASCSQEAQAQAIAGLGTLALVIYTGYTIPKPSMIGALRWFVTRFPLHRNVSMLIVSYQVNLY